MSNNSYYKLIGILQWLDCGNRSDIAYAPSSLARFRRNLGLVHWETVRRVLHYLKGTKGWKLGFGGHVQQIAGYTDTNWGGDQDDRRSISVYIFNLSSGAIDLRIPVFWLSSSGPFVVLGQTEWGCSLF